MRKDLNYTYHLIVVDRKKMQIEGLVQECCNSIANALELLQSCAKPLKYIFMFLTMNSAPQGLMSPVLGVFDLSSYLEHLFFSGSQLVALSPVGKIGVWHAMTQNWQVRRGQARTGFSQVFKFLKSPDL